MTDETEAAVEPKTVAAKAAEAKKPAAPAPTAPKARRIRNEQTAQTRVVVEKTMEHATKTTETLTKAAEDAAEFSRGNIEALTKATQLYMAGVQDPGKQTMALMQGLADHSMEGAKALSTVKSLKEAADIQANYTRAAFEKSFAETAKLQEAALKLAESSFAPITARMTLAVEKLAKPIAA